MTAIQSLGLVVFPFGAYDSYGCLKVDPKVADDFKRELKPLPFASSPADPVLPTSRWSSWLRLQSSSRR